MDAKDWVKYEPQIVFWIQSLLGAIFPAAFNIKDLWHVHSQPRVRFDKNFSISRYSKNLKKY